MAKLDPKEQVAKPAEKAAPSTKSKPGPKPKLAPAVTVDSKDELPWQGPETLTAAQEKKINHLQDKVDSIYGKYSPNSYGSQIRAAVPPKVLEIHGTLSQHGKLLTNMANHHLSFGLPEDVHSEIMGHVNSADFNTFEAQKRIAGGDKVGAAALFQNATREHQLAAKKLIRNTDKPKGLMPAIFDIADGDAKSSLDEAHIKAIN